VGICENSNRSLGSLEAGEVVEKLRLFTFSGLHSTTAGNVAVPTKNDGRPTMCKCMVYVGYVIPQTVSCWSLTGLDPRAVQAGRVVEKVALG
jgi:hypothetical protein